MRRARRTVSTLRVGVTAEYGSARRERYVLFVSPIDQSRFEQQGWSVSEHLRVTLQQHLPDVLVRGRLPKDGEGGTVLRAVWGVAPCDADHVIQLALSAFDVDFMSHAGALTFEFKSIGIGIGGVSFGFGDGSTIMIAKRGVRESPRSEPPAKAQDAQDAFAARCLVVPYFEMMKDDRWFSHFEELPEIDALSQSGKAREALAPCREGLERHPDSFLFFKRGAALHDELGERDAAAKLLEQGLARA